MKAKIFLLIFIVLLFSCKEKDYKNDDMYEILSVLINKLSKEKMFYHAFPAPPPILNINLDSLKGKMEKNLINKIDSLIKKNGKLIIGIRPIFNSTDSYDLKNIHFQEYLDEYEKIYNSFKALKDTIKLDVDKISPNEYSYFLPYNRDYEKRKRYEKFDFIISFSRISFDKGETKAIVIMSASFGNLNGFSAIYFMEKKNSNWFIKHEKGLSIS